MLRGAFGPAEHFFTTSGNPRVSTLIFLVAVVLYTTLAAVGDAWKHRIPNALTVPAALLGLVYHTWISGSAGVLWAASGLVVGFLLLLLPWLLGGGGMGDVKLLAALGVWLGPKWILVDFAGSILLAALGALGVLLVSGLRHGVSATRRQIEAGPSGTAQRRKRIVPFGIPVALSTWLLLAWLVARGAL